MWKRCAGAAADEPIFSDEGLELYSVQSGRSSELVGRGAIALYRDRLELPGGISVPVGEISGMSLRGPTDLYLSTSNGGSFLLRTHLALCTHKYLSACLFLGSPVGVGV